MITKEIASKFLVGYVYKWILPIITTLIMLLGKDAKSNLIIQFIFWILLMVAYLSIPWNFEFPKFEYYEAYIYNKILYPFIVSLQVFFLSLVMFAITTLTCIWFISFLESSAYIIGALNASLYAGCMIFEFARLPARFSDASQKE